MRKAQNYFTIKAHARTHAVLQFINGIYWNMVYNVHCNTYAYSISKYKMYMTMPHDVSCQVFYMFNYVENFLEQ